MVDLTKVHIKQLDPIGERAVWLVHGEYIRKNIDENFVGYAGHARFPFIPLNEFWIDQASEEKERHFFITNLVNTAWAVESGKTLTEAEAIGLKAEKRDRSKMLAVEGGTLNLSTEEILKKIERVAIPEYSGKIITYLVTGDAVRNYFTPDYLYGGHDRVYRFIPHGEIWIEKDITPHEQPFIILHELHERYLMGEGKSYEHAHQGATIIEDYYRTHNSHLKERVAEELAKNEKQERSTDTKDTILKLAH